MCLCTERLCNYTSNVPKVNHRHSSKTQGRGPCLLTVNCSFISPECSVYFGGGKKQAFLKCVRVWVKESIQGECECKWVAIDGGVNRRLMTEGWKTLGEALWCVRCVNPATSTGMWGLRSLVPSLILTPTQHLLFIYIWSCKCIYIYLFNRCDITSLAARSWRDWTGRPCGPRLSVLMHQHPSVSLVSCQMNSAG